MTQLALQLEPSRVDTAAALDEMVAESDRAVARLLLPCSVVEGVPSSIPGALARAAEWQRCREQPRDFCDRLMDELDLANRRAEEDLQHIRGMLAELERVPVEQLDQHLAAREAEEKRMREEARAEKPSRASGGKAAKGDGATIGIGRAALSERQRELLAFVRVENNVAIFSSEERVPDWDLLKRIMVALGGTWKTGGKKAPGGFRFPDDLDAAELVRLAKETGEITDPKVAEAFFTPDALANALVERIGHLDPRAEVLEPSAGDGALVRAVLRRCPTAWITCVEALAPHIAKLNAMADQERVCVVPGDFMQKSAADLGTFLAIAQNPPFSREIEHVRHAYTFLKPGGVLVAIMSAGIKYREDKHRKSFRLWVAEHDGAIWENPEGSFEPATSVRTVMVRVRRPA